jgi:hypothetical protein
MIDNGNFDGEMIELASAPNPFTQRVGSSISKRAGMQDFREAVANPAIQLRDGTTYRIRILRSPDSISVEIDGTHALRCRIPTSLDCGLTLQAIYGPPGNKVEVKNIDIRAPKPAIERRAAWLQLQKWLAEDLLIDSVVKKIDQNDQWSLELRRYAKLRAAGMRENAEALVERVTSWLDESGGLDPKLKSNAIMLTQRAVALEDRWQDWLLLAVTYGANNQDQQAISALKSAFEKCQKRRGVIAPAIWAWLAIYNNEIGRNSAATTALQKANRAVQLNRGASDWDRVAKRLQTSFPAAWQDNGLDQQQRELLDLLLAESFDSQQWYADQFVYQYFRGDQANSVSLTLDRTQWLEMGEFLGGSGVIGFHDLTLNDVEVKIVGERAAVRFDAYRNGSLAAMGMARYAGWQHQQVVLDLARNSQGVWQLIRHSVRPLEELSFSKTVALDTARLAALDAEIAQNSTAIGDMTDGELLQYVLQLHAALRDADAFQAIQQLTARKTARASDWVLQSQLAVAVGNVKLARQAAEQAIAIQPSVDGPDYLLKMARAIRGDNAWVNIGRGFEAQVPSEWKLMGSDAFVGADGFQVGWLIEAPQAVLSTRLSIGGIGTEQFLEQMRQANEQLKREAIKEEKLVNIQGVKDAVWMEFAGAGNGGMVDGRGPIKTHQVLVLLFLDDEILLVTAVGPEQTWEPLGAAFEKMVQSIRPVEGTLSNKLEAEAE